MLGPKGACCVYLEGGAVDGPKHVMLCCQGHISGHMHQLSSLHQRARRSRRLADCFSRICAACSPWLLLLGVLVCPVGYEADCPLWFVIITVICLWTQTKSGVAF